MRWLNPTFLTLSFGADPPKQWGTIYFPYQSVYYGTVQW